MTNEVRILLKRVRKTFGDQDKVGQPFSNSFWYVRLKKIDAMIVRSSQYVKKINQKLMQRANHPISN